MPDLSCFAATRRWWPACLMDETMPPGRATPEAWLEPDGNGVTPIYWDDDDSRHLCDTIDPATEVAFVWCENRGGVEILLMPDGTWSVADPRDTLTIDMFTGEPSNPMPPTGFIEAANWFAEISDYETMADSMDEFAQNYAAFGMIEPDGERVSVVMAYWSDEVKFRVSADGKSLEAVE